MYEDDLFDSLIEEKLNKRDAEAAQELYESAQHSLQQTQTAILDFAKSYCRFFNVSSEVDAHIKNFAVAWQDQQTMESILQHTTAASVKGSSPAKRYTDES